MLSDSLATNQVKNAAGTEVEFSLLQRNGRTAEFAQVGESPALPYRLKVSHLETGSGLKQRRRSMFRFDKTTLSTVDDVTPITTSCIVIGDFPVGASETSAEMANVIANAMSFLGSLGASTTILYDGTGNGAATLIAGSL